MPAPVPAAGRRRFGSRGLGLLPLLLFLLASLARRRVVLGGRRGVRGGGEAFFSFFRRLRSARSASSSVATAASASLRFFLRTLSLSEPMLSQRSQRAEAAQTL